MDDQGKLDFGKAGDDLRRRFDARAGLLAA